jgi:hypothetical protein
MLLETEQIKLSYESLGMSVLDIAENRHLEPEAVKIALASCSSKFRKDCGLEDSVPNQEKESEKNFTDEQLERANETILNLAIGAENETVKLKAAIYIRDDKRGRLDAIKQLAGMPINVLQINNIIQQSMEKANALIYRPRKEEEKAAISV